MPTYPDVPTKTEAVLPVNKIETDVSDGGILFAQDKSATSVYDISLKHPLLTAAEIATLRSFYDTNKNTIVTTQTLGDGSTYDVLLVREPELVETRGVFNTMVQKLVGTRN